MSEKKRSAEATGPTGPERRFSTATPAPAEPSDAGSSTPRTTPPVYPTDYDTSGQAHAPEVPYPGNAGHSGPTGPSGA